MATDTAVREGIFLVGTYEGSRQGREFQRRDGTKAQTVELGVRMGDDVVAVRYDDGEAAQAALAEGGSPAQGERIELRVFVRLVKDYDRRFAFVTYEGPRAGGSQDGGWA